VQMLDRQRVQQATADEAKKLVDTVIHQLLREGTSHTSSRVDGRLE
jgi:hypothetical protein